MVKLLRRRRTNGNGSAPEAAGPDAPVEVTDATEAAGATEVADATADTPDTTDIPEATETPAPEPTPAERRDTYEVPAGAEAPSLGAVGSDPPIPYEPAPPPPPPPRSTGGLLSRSILDPGEMTAEERDRIAAMEFEQAIAPVMELMRAAVPGADTPEDAARILSENQPEIPPDPGGGAYIPGDAYDQDARVYYRLLRRDYEKNPRPSQKQPVSPHLHGVYTKLTGTKGW